MQATVQDKFNLIFRERNFTRAPDRPHKKSAHNQSARPIVKQVETLFLLFITLVGIAAFVFYVYYVLYEIR